MATNAPMIRNQRLAFLMAKPLGNRSSDFPARGGSSSRWKSNPMPPSLERLGSILIERHAHDLGSLHGVSSVEHRDDVLGNAVDHRDLPVAAHAHEAVLAVGREREPVDGSGERYRGVLLLIAAR